jgi:hypothetical protein
MADWTRDGDVPHVGKVGGATTVAAVTLSIDTAAYASGDLIADTQIVEGALRLTNGTGVLQSLVLVDRADQGVALDVYFLDSSVTMGTENSAPSISDDNAGSILGVVSLTTSDYNDLGGARVGHKENIGIVLKAASGTDDIYVAVVNGTGTPTYGAADALRLRLGILQD